MPTHHIETILKYTPKQLYDLVADIESYPELFHGVTVRGFMSAMAMLCLADLIIHFRGITGKYTSRVMLDEEENEISVELRRGLSIIYIRAEIHCDSW